MNDVRVRFAPSPTGDLHLGGARTALYNWLYARQMGGTYLLRLEDTDRERSTPEAEAQILRTLDWLGLGADNPAEIVRQSEREGRYKEAIDQLQKSGKLYEANDLTPSEDGRLPLRLRVEGAIEFNDLVRGKMSFHGDHIQDPIVVRSDGSATYNLAASIDDLDMRVSHIFRGDDHLSNTPIQLAARRALDPDGKLPVFAHLPMILGEDGHKLSKRNGAASVEDYFDFLPDALLNYLALLGWAPEGEENILTREQLIEKFAITRVGSSPARYDRKLLEHVQGHHIRSLSKEQWLKSYKGGHDPEQAYYLMHDKMLTWNDEAKLMQPLAEPLKMDADIAFVEDDRPIIDAARTKLNSLEIWSEESVGLALREMCTDLGIKPRKAIPVVQNAVMGQRRGTSLFRVADLIGKDNTLARIDAAATLIDSPRLEPLDEMSDPKISNRVDGLRFN